MSLYADKKALKERAITNGHALGRWHTFNNDQISFIWVSCQKCGRNGVVQSSDQYVQPNNGLLVIEECELH